ncbi:VOC family protein [Vibrio lentus]|nr:VOC family protein [Vibrio lentus]
MSPAFWLFFFCSQQLKVVLAEIVVTSVPVEDQDKALDFYTNILGFIKKTEVPLGRPSNL